MRPSPRIFAGARRAPLHPLLAGSASLVASLGLLLALAPAARAKVYFTAFPAEGGTGIERAGLDGSHRESLEFQPIGFADAIALDLKGGKMYWTETSAGAIWRANLNGSEAQPVLIDSGREPLGIALDLAHDRMYWTDSEGVERAKLDGTGTELLTKEGARGFIALDLAKQQMFWADWPSGTIRSAPMTGKVTVTEIAKGEPCPFGIAVDEADGNVYWLGLEVKEKPRCEKNASIARAKLDGSAAKTIVKRPGAGFEGGLAVDSAAGKIYWTEAEAHDVRAANLDGSGEHVLVGAGGDFPIGLAVESADPRPSSTSAPVIEGSPVVGSPLFCNAGSWTGVGPISLTWQWQLASGAAIEGATTSSFVAATELAGASVRCEVTAADSVETTSAISPAVTIAAYPAAPARQPLIAAIALEHLTARGSRASVPVFASVAGIATLRAIPPPNARMRPARRHGGRSPARARRRTSAVRAIVVRRAVPAGRSAIELSG
ncbi:MAG TPA: hypothetical protein VH115_02235, partial [Solirubrobacteraceae bacterium]|nr:hypothetical protein [Solirubrobacteraceae bacterium]